MMFAITVPLLAAASLAVAQHTPRDAVATVEACQQVLHRCMLEGCEDADVVRACPMGGLSERSLAIVRTEAVSARDRIESADQRAACAEDFTAFWEAAKARLDPDNLLFGYPDGPDAPAPTELTQNTIIRAELDRAMTGRLEAFVNAETAWTCPIPPWSPLAMLRGQNLAFAEDHRLLERLSPVGEAPGWANAAHYIYVHADLWQPEQVRALETFEARVESGALSEDRNTALRNRVAGHQPLYDDADLADDWPTRSD
jgi:hypothetical protein